MDKNIKDYRESELRSFVIGNMILVMFGMGKLNPIIKPSSDSSWLLMLNSFLSSILFSALICIFVFVSDSLISARVKDGIIWLWQKLPGGRVFTKLGKNKDPRINNENAKEQYADLYRDLDQTIDAKSKWNKQNSYWYQLYQKHEGEAQVFVANRDYLLCRDMCTMIIWIIIGFVLLTIYLKEPFSYMTLFVLILEFLVVWIAARNKGKRLVSNVIAKDLASK